jgi:hypothetical protein
VNHLWADPGGESPGSPCSEPRPGGVVGIGMAFAVGYDPDS